MAPRPGSPPRPPATPPLRSVGAKGACQRPNAPAGPLLTISDGNGDAEVEVASIAGTWVTAVNLFAGGTGYSIASNVATHDGGAQRSVHVSLNGVQTGCSPWDCPDDCHHGGHHRNQHDDQYDRHHNYQHHDHRPRRRRLRECGYGEAAMLSDWPPIPPGTELSDGSYQACNTDFLICFRASAAV